MGVDRKDGITGAGQAYAYLPEFMFADWVNDYERWCVQLMYLVREAVRDVIPEKSAPYFSDKYMANNAYTFVMNEASIAMETFVRNLDVADIRVPIFLLEPLLAVAKYTVDYGTTDKQFDTMCRRLLLNAQPDR